MKDYLTLVKISSMALAHSAKASNFTWILHKEAYTIKLGNSPSRANCIMMPTRGV
jgi:hypothetical protein